MGASYIMPGTRDQLLDETWKIVASCNAPDVDPAIFFVEATRSKVDRLNIEMAKLVCAGCPVKDDCLEYALASNAYWIWGGTTEAERKKIRKERRMLALTILDPGAA